jgi:gliding motility-associated-like protein
MTTLKTKKCIFFSLAVLITAQAIGQQNNFEWVENKGQLNQQAKFAADIGGGAFFLEKNGFSVLLHHPEDLEQLTLHHHRAFAIKKQTPTLTNATTAAATNTLNTPNKLTTPTSPTLIRSHAYKVRFEGSNETVQIVPDKIQAHYNNYFIGNDKKKWASHCNIYKTVLYKNMYKGIDVRYYSDNGTLKYDIIVAPQAKPDIVLMKYEGVDKLTIKNEELYIKTSVGEVKELYPYAYQFDPIKGKVQVSCKFQIVEGNTIKFKIKNYNPNLPLVIDPTLVFSTFTGGANNYGFTATPGPGGTFFSGSIVFSNGFPVTPGAFQQNFGGGNSQQTNPTDIGIVKFNATGTARLYATFLGGNGNDYPHSIISDPQGNLVIIGRTYSGNNFPITIAPVGTLGGADLFVTKLNANGSGLIGSMVVGGSGDDAVNVTDQQYNQGNDGAISILRFYGDDARSEVNLDNAGNIYVATQTQSTNFPVTNGAFQTTSGGKQDGALLKVNPSCNNVIFASYLGGNEDDGAFVVDINPTNNDIYVGGATVSRNFPGNKTTAWQSTYQGGNSDGYLAVIKNDGTALLRSTYLGTSDYDAVYGVKFDKLGLPYVMGIAQGNWPIINAAYANAGAKQFVAKLPTTLAAPIYSTTFGTAAAQPNISPVAFLVDRCENVYISGWGGWLFPISAQSQDPYGQAGVVGMPTTPGAIKGSGGNQTDNRDFYFIVIEKNAQALLYGSCFGQNGGDGEHVDGGTSRFDQQGVIYQAICANCGGSSQIPITSPYPITPGAVAPINGGLPRGCNLGAVKISFNFAGVGSGVKAFIDGVFDTSGCVPLTVVFNDTVRNAKTYEWDFNGDGTTDQITNATQFNATYTYNTIGNYRLRLIAVDSNTCNIRDTAYITVRVRDDKAFPDFTIAKTNPNCNILAYDFDNSASIPAAGKPFKNNSFIWDFGDNNRITAGIGVVSHTYPSPGTYTVKLFLVDTNYCNAPDSVVKDLRVSPVVKAQFETAKLGCVPYTAVFKNTSLGGQTFVWSFGDGTTSTDANPLPKLYIDTGTYIVRLIATDPFTCNKVDTSLPFTIVVRGKPTAAFTYSPVVPQVNFPYTFSNTSSVDAVLFKWLFGDGDSLITTSRAPVDHQYNATATYTALLIAYNDAGCPDTTAQLIKNIIDPKLDVPNAFTPAGPNNNIVLVRGYGIARMRWRIYNRFGNLVFESTNRNAGWDGKYKGQIQPMEVYAYTLEVEFTDGVRTSKKGDITLLR